MRYWQLKGYCAPEITNGIEKKGKKFLKPMLNETVMNVNWDGNQNICETIITIIPCTQATMKHDQYEKISFSPSLNVESKSN